MNFVYLGYNRYDAATNLALDEAALNAAERNQKSYIRFYDFDQPVVILSHRQGKGDINEEKCKELGVDVNRRMSGGTAILCNENTLAYSIATPFYNPDSAHRYFGTKIAGVLRDVGIGNLSIGEHYSVRVNGHTIAGHGQRYRLGRSLLYHGVLAVEPWDHELINDVISLREDGEYDFVKKLPSVNQYVAVKKETLVQRLLESFTNGQYEKSEVDILYPDAALLKLNKYTDSSWIYDNGSASRLGFCFVARKEKQNAFY